MAGELCIRGISSLPPTTKVTFVEAVPESFRCKLCHNLSAELLEDSDGHAYCQSCINMLNEDGTFTCVVDDVVEEVADLTSCADICRQLLGLVVKCPNQNKGCKFQASLKDLTLHYPNCHAGTNKAFPNAVKCPWCTSVFDAKELTSHMADDCPERPLECSFCGNSFRERNIDEHMSRCDKRPEACEFCETLFETYAELRDVHYPICEKKPVDCPYKSFGCGFQGLKVELTQHLHNSLDIHTTTLVRAVVDVMDGLKSIKKDVLQLRAQVAGAENIKKVEEEVQQLRNRIGDAQNAQSEALQHQLTMEDKVAVVSKRLETVERTMDNVAKEAVSGVADRLAQLETNVNEFLKPMEILLKNVATL